MTELKRAAWSRSRSKTNAAEKVLREAQQRYAQHLDTCAAIGKQREWRAKGSDGYWATPACNCGLAAALAASPDGER